MIYKTLLIIIVILAIFQPFKVHKDALTVQKPDIQVTYNDSYADQYDRLTYDSIRTKEEIDYIMTLLNEESVVLDIGSGSGHHVNALSIRGIRASGLDKSTAMISLAKKRYNDVFLLGDALNTSHFPMESFTHITCLYFTLYHMKNKLTFFKNCHQWLMPGGYLIVHISDKWAYGPTSRLKGYTSNYSHTVHRETIDGQGYRQNIYMESVNDIIAMASRAGFSVHSIYKYKCPYMGQYMYVFQ